MPAYDFKCRSCANVFEVTRAATDDSPVCCPECGGDTKRVFTPVGVHFKGSGFHNTDYRKKDTSATPATTAPAPCPSAGTSGGCETCPASKPE